MKNQTLEEVPLVNIERSPLFLLFFVAGTVLLGGWTWHLFDIIDPLGFLIMIPAAIVAFQTLWLVLTPFAIIYDSRADIKQSWIHQKERYFNDLLKVSENQKGHLFITYTDGEVEKISLVGIKTSHKKLLKENFVKLINTKAAARN